MAGDWKLPSRLQLVVCFMCFMEQLMRGVQAAEAQQRLMLFLLHHVMPAAASQRVDAVVCCLRWHKINVCTTLCSSTLGLLPDGAVAALKLEKVGPPLEHQSCENISRSQDQRMPDENLERWLPASYLYVERHVPARGLVTEVATDYSSGSSAGNAQLMDALANAAKHAALLLPWAMRFGGLLFMTAGMHCRCTAEQPTQVDPLHTGSSRLTQH
ncbi:hypothetical protein COO60DRAFT_1627101 [Scenedesmus sp. NREL 46B-D3]|nr:hypothetical protein COO60DRAFT_1627101 [Scenedesmus sp. NREL 46B-D3]